MENITIETNKITKDTTLSILSDIHYTNRSYCAKYLEYIIKKIKLIKPNYICIPGDIIDTASNIDIHYLKEFFYILLEYCQKDIIITLGDRDIRDFDINGNPIKGDPSFVFNHICSISPRIKLLNNRLYTTEENINFIGIFANFFYYNKVHEDNEHIIDYFNYLLENINHNSFNTLLFHSPVILKEEVFTSIKALQEIDLGIFGHYQGGLVPHFLKSYFDKKFKDKQGIINPQGEKNPKHCYGLEKRDNFISYVSSGICPANPNLGIKATTINKLYKPDIQTIKLEKIK